MDSRKRIDLHPQQRRGGVYFQKIPPCFPNMTLRQNILCGLRNQPDKAQRVKADDMIAMMDLQGLEKHRPYQLSGGQQQRAALGRILGEQAKAS